MQVLITGTFLTNKEHVENCNWSCMFGDVEVPAEVLADGSLRCYTPLHQSGRVPFYVTCSNRVACSEIREFEFRDSEAQYMESADPHTTGINEMHLHIRIEKLLSLGPDDYEKYVMSDGNEKAELISTIGSLMLDENFTNLASPSDEKVYNLTTFASIADGRNHRPGNHRVVHNKLKYPHGHRMWQSSSSLKHSGGREVCGSSWSTSPLLHLHIRCKIVLEPKRLEWTMTW